jgi:hypothetical protein
MRLLGGCNGGSDVGASAKAAKEFEHTIKAVFAA